MVDRWSLIGTLRGAVRPVLVAAWGTSLALVAVTAQLRVVPLPDALLEEARAALASGAYDAATANLRHLRLLHAESPLVADALMLAAEVAAARDNPVQERYLLGEARYAVQRLTASGALTSAAANDFHLRITSRLAVLLEEERDYESALRSYTEAIALLAARSGAASSTAESRPLARLRLAAARLAYRYGVGEPGDAERFFDQVDAAHLTGTDAMIHRELARGLMWNYLTPRQLGMNDSNISAIATDGDDIWVGGWTGGLVRYARSTGRKSVFQEGPRSLVSLRVRDIRTIDGYVWVGTDQGLSTYSLASSRWRHERALGDTARPSPVAAIARVGDAIFAGTLGHGLWRHDGSGWRAVGGALPGPFVNALQVVGDTLWIGTIDLGLVGLDIETGAMRSFDEVNPDIGPQNVTAIVSGASDDLWVTTFGDGVYRWEPAPNRVTHFSVAGGQLPDNWVLAGAAGEQGIYFGTFGGGAVRYSPEHDTWTAISLPHGLPSLNVAVVTAARGHIYFGTLGGGVAVLAERRSLHGL